MAAVTSVVLYDPRDTSPEVQTIVGCLTGTPAGPERATARPQVFYRWCEYHHPRSGMIWFHPEPFQRRSSIDAGAQDRPARSGDAVVMARSAGEVSSARPAATAATAAMAPRRPTAAAQRPT